MCAQRYYQLKIIWCNKDLLLAHIFNPPSVHKENFSSKQLFTLAFHFSQRVAVLSIPKTMLHNQCLSYHLMMQRGCNYIKLQAPAN